MSFIISVFRVLAVMQGIEGLLTCAIYGHAFHSVDYATLREWCHGVQLVACAALWLAIANYLERKYPR